MVRFVHLVRMNFIQLEGVAAEVLAKAEVILPVDAFLIALSLGLMLTPVGRYEEAFDGREVRFFGRAPRRDQQEFVARCAARAALVRHGYFVTEMNVDRLARALMLPRRIFVADWKRGINWTRARHANVTAAMLGARAAELGLSTEHLLTAEHVGLAALA